MGRTATAYIGMGSNLGDRAAAIDAALEMLEATPGLHIRRSSRVRETAPVGKTDQPRFLNAAVEVSTSLAPSTLLHRLLEIEARLGRVRRERWGPRIIDLDLLMHGRRALKTRELTLPHPRLAERAFVLESLHDLCPDADVPGTGCTVSELLERCVERSPR